MHRCLSSGLSRLNGGGFVVSIYDLGDRQLVSITCSWWSTGCVGRLKSSLYVLYVLVGSTANLDVLEVGFDILEEG